MTRRPQKLFSYNGLDWTCRIVAWTEGGTGPAPSATPTGRPAANTASSTTTPTATRAIKTLPQLHPRHTATPKLGTFHRARAASQPSLSARRGMPTDWLDVLVESEVVELP